MLEVDLPAHAQGLVPLKKKGMEFCEPSDWERNPPERATTVYDDPRGRTRKVLRQLLGETIEAFGEQEQWFHVLTLAPRALLEEGTLT